MSAKKEIWVYAHWEQFKEPVHMGILLSVGTKGKEVFSFEYTPEWLATGSHVILDPDLQLYSGKYFPRDDKPNFGMFLDSCPDRWGRVLMERKEAAIARKEKRAPKTLLESDFLLGLYDMHRMGALRFKLNGEGSFLNDDPQLTVPPWTSLRELEAASKHFEEDDIGDKEYLKWINMLLAPGSSLGGARPKASVLDPKQHLWIAKFPSIKDNKDIGGWEMVAHILAKKAGLTVPDVQAKNISGKHHTFLSKRFDRTTKRKRVHFASAMTMLGRSDGDGSTEGVSYLDIAEFLIRNGAEVNKHLEELWKRIVFNISIKNTDDHLRNHGFLLTENGWTLSPAYDMNPNEYGSGLSLNISEKDNSLDLDLALSIVNQFRVSDKLARKIITQVNSSVIQWRLVANNVGLTKAEQDRMALAFE